MIPRQLTADEILSSIQTETDAERAVEELENDIDDITTQISNQRIFYDQGEFTEADYSAWLRRAVAARTHKERALLRIQRWIKHQEHQRQQQEVAQQKRAAIQAKQADTTVEDRELAREYKRIALQATKQKIEARDVVIMRERKVMELLDTIAARNDPALLNAANDLLLTLAQSHRVTYTADEEVVINAIGAVVGTWRKSRGEA